MTPFHSSAFAAILSCSAFTAGINFSFVFIAVAIYIAEGNESLDDCAILT